MVAATTVMFGGRFRYATGGISRRRTREAVTVQPYRIIGIESSPYAVKVRAVMRYRHIPYVWVARMPQFHAETRAVRPLLMPVVQFPDGTYRTDSTPILAELEQRYPGTRSIVPAPPGDAFVSALIEDMADEWLTKSLFHYRFSRDRDAASAAQWVMDDAHPDLGHAALTKLSREFVARQTSRMPLVGCTPGNAPVLEHFYLELLRVLESYVATDRFLFGQRPALADFGLYGQLKTLAADPTPGDIMRREAPRTAHWVLRLDDASGVDGTWAGSCRDVIPGLLDLAGRYYLPFLAANRRALDDGGGTVAMDIDGRPYAQPAYRYQGKCFDYLRHAYAALDEAARERIAPLLANSGCAAYLES